MRSHSLWNYGVPGSKLRSRLSMTSWMLLSCLYCCGEDVEVTEGFTFLINDIVMVLRDSQNNHKGPSV